MAVRAVIEVQAPQDAVAELMRQQVEATRENTAALKGLQAFTMQQAQNRLPEPMSLPVTTRGDKVTKVEKAIQMLRDNPSWVDKTTRDLEELTDIDRNTWSKAKGRL